MARAQLGLALAAALLVLLLTSILTLDFGSSTENNYHTQRHGWTDFWKTFPFTRQRPLSVAGPQTGAPGHIDEQTEYLLGAGKADITGPVVELNLMGYADPAQVGTGLRQRLYSRAFIVGNVDHPEERFIYLVLDTQSGDTAIRYGILEALKHLGSEYKIYDQRNVAVVGTHSHSGPGAWLNYLLPQITSKGFNKQSYQAIVDGAVLSIKRAHFSLRRGTLSVGSVEVDDANISRSLYAYLANPKQEREKYSHSVDKTLTLLKFQDSKTQETIAILNWFPVHGTSMLGNNTLISGDNKGVAATLLENHARNTAGFAPGFVAGFSQANVGDTSPNVLGAFCEDGSGTECDFKDSTCNGKNEPCHGRGPFFREKDQGASSCYEIGTRQAEAAKTLLGQMSKDGIAVSGPTVKSFHTFQSLQNYTFAHPNGSIVSTCPAALGYSFAAGTTDGPGAFDFKQNDTDDTKQNPIWAVIRGFLHEPTDGQKACHHPKPILLDVGEITEPYLWTPNIVDIQMLRVGQLVIIVSPGEATTMSGRRWRSAVHAAAKEHLDLGVKEDPIVVLGGPANSYTHYIATEEEYGVQRYEGASTLYGPHTLNAYINLTTTYLPHLHSLSTDSLPTGDLPPNNVNKSLSFITGVIRDGTPFFRSFGDVLVDVNAAEIYKAGASTVKVTFVGANPRNDLRLEDTYAAVEQYLPERGGTWVRVRSDADWYLVFHWRRISTLLGTSEVDIVWEIEGDTPPGRYRVRYYGASKSLLGGKISQFEGTSGVFEVR